MYYTGINPFTGERIFVEKNLKGKSFQKEVLLKKKEKGGGIRTGLALKKQIRKKY
jgi:hypothetical protein